MGTELGDMVTERIVAIVRSLMSRTAVEEGGDSFVTRVVKRKAG